MLRNMTSSLRLTLAGMALLTATALGVYTYGPSRKAAPIVQLAPPPPLPTSYLVAAHSLPAGSLARDTDFATRSVPRADVPPNAIINTPDAQASLRGALVRTFIDANQPIMQTDILRPRDRGFIATVLAPGTRAVSIGVDAVSDVAGLVWPGDHVDVLLTHDLGESVAAADRMVTEVILTNVRIIAADQQIVQGAIDATTAGKVAQTVTLQVEPAQVEKIVMAAHLGKLSLAIRAASDEQNAAIHEQGPTFGGDISPALASESGASVSLVEGQNRKEIIFKGKK